MFFYQRFSILYLRNYYGGLAQLARALAWHARGRRFDPDTLHLFFNDLCMINITHFCEVKPR